MRSLPFCNRGRLFCWSVLVGSFFFSLQPFEFIIKQKMFYFYSATAIVLFLLVLFSLSICHGVFQEEKYVYVFCEEKLVFCVHCCMCVHAGLNKLKYKYCLIHPSFEESPLNKVHLQNPAEYDVRFWLKPQNKSWFLSCDVFHCIKTLWAHVIDISFCPFVFESGKTTPLTVLESKPSISFWVCCHKKPFVWELCHLKEELLLFAVGQDLISCCLLNWAWGDGAALIPLKRQRDEEKHCFTTEAMFSNIQQFLADTVTASPHSN